ncbi:MAG: S9 family peptidase [Gammaproteobacteria bacterium]
MKPKTERYGAWKSPLSAEAVATSATRMYQPRRSGETFWWVETRPAEGGRTVLVRQDRGRRRDLNPAPLSVRSRVHEYGGGAWCTDGDQAWFVNDEDQVIWHLGADGHCRPLTQADQRRYADLVRDPVRPRLLAVCEDHSGDGEPENSLVAISDDGRVESLVSGSDFYSNPRLDPRGEHLAWLSWNHPRLPWDGNGLWVAPLDAGGRPGPARQIAGADRVSVFQPDWLPDGRLGFVADPDGWWNHFTWDGAQVSRLTRMQAEAGLPQWVFGQSTWGPVAGGVLAAVTLDGTWDLLLAGQGLPARISWNPGAFEHLATDGREAVVLGGAPDRPTAIYALDVPGFRPRLIAESGPLPLDPLWISIPEPITFPSGGDEAHALFYPPCNPMYRGPENAAPPVIVKCHGGPTGATSTAFDPKIQFWTSRGFAVLDVNYRGSTGYGRRYRESLYGRWGLVDVEDCVAAVSRLAREGRVDPRAALISGGSAGGYTVLCALAFTSAFRAGTSYYGIGDLEAMFATTHKFEAHYDHWLVGPLDDARTRETMAARSPLRHADEISCPVLFLQGGKDRVVPPEQSRAMHRALKDAGIPTAYLEFPEEGHGFRRGENITRALEAELVFYGRLLGFRPPGPLPTLHMDNADAL